MAPRHPTPEGYAAECRAAPGEIAPPHDGAVFYTNGDRDTAVRFAERETALGRPTVTLEGHRDTGACGTRHGCRTDRDRLFDNTDPDTRGFNVREAQRTHAETGQVVLAKDAGARRVWRETSAAYAARASGRVTVFTGDAPIRDQSYFARCERDVLIRNEKVTSINGVSREELAAVLDQRDRGRISQEASNAAINRRIEAGEARLDPRRADPAPQSRWERRRAAPEEGAGTKSRGWGEKQATRTADPSHPVPGGKSAPPRR